jgi:hypothetical protein
MYQGLVLYIGSTANEKRRQREHKYRGDSVPKDIDWTWHILESYIDPEERYIREQFWIEECQPIYNKNNPNSFKKLNWNS